MTRKALRDTYAAAAKGELSALASIGASYSLKQRVCRRLSHSAINVDDHGQLLRGTCNTAKTQVRLQSATDWVGR